MSEAQALPPGWILTTVRQIGQGGEQAVLTGPFGTSMGRSDFTDSGVPVLTIGCLTQHGVDLSKAMHVAPAKAAALQRYQLRHGDLLFSRMATVGRASIVERRFEGSLFNYHLMRLRLLPEVIDPRLFVYYVHGSQMVRDYVRSVNHGATRDGINTEQLLDLPVLLPPPSAQPGIIAAIESYFSRLDAATATLERVQRNLERYRASVLKAAVEGRLVPTEAELAKKGGRTYEPASTLLKRILTERRRRWEEAELAKLTAKGKKPTDDKWKAKYEEPAAPDVAGLPELPEGWCWTRIDTAGRVQLGRQRSPAHHSGTHMRPYLRVANVFEARIDSSDVMTMNFTPEEFETYRLRFGDILLNEGQSPHLVGRPAMYREEVPGACFTNSLVRFQASPDVDPRFALVVFLAQLHMRRYMRIAQITTNIAHLGAGRFAEIEFPLPPLQEQARIADEVARLMSTVLATKTCVATDLARVKRLRQSILKWAFEGRLADRAADAGAPDPAPDRGSRVSE